MNQRSHEQLTMTRILTVLCAVCLMAVPALPVAATSPDEKGEPKRQASESVSAESGEFSAAAQERMKVIVDPETGEIISVPIRQQTGTLSAPLAKALNRSAEGLRVFELENGGKGVHLDGRFQHALVVRVKPDGSLETVCTNHSRAAEKFLQGKSAGADAAPRDK